MDADIYGITPSANMEKFPREPPFITLKKKKNPRFPVSCTFGIPGTTMAFPTTNISKHISVK